MQRGAIQADDADFDGLHWLHHPSSPPDNLVSAFEAKLAKRANAAEVENSTGAAVGPDRDNRTGLGS